MLKSKDDGLSHLVFATITKCVMLHLRNGHAWREALASSSRRAVRMARAAGDPD